MILKNQKYYEHLFFTRFLKYQNRRDHTQGKRNHPLKYIKIENSANVVIQCIANGTLLYRDVIPLSLFTKFTDYLFLQYDPGIM